MDEQPTDPIAALGSPKFIPRPIWPTSLSWCMWCGEEYSDNERLPGPLCFAKGVEAYRAGKVLS